MNQPLTHTHRTDTRYGVAICAVMLAYAKGLMRDEDCEPTEIFTEGFLPSFAIFLVCFHSPTSQTQHTHSPGASVQVMWTASYSTLHP